VSENPLFSRVFAFLCYFTTPDFSFFQSLFVK
jgi:hypothetical protein